MMTIRRYFLARQGKGVPLVDPSGSRERVRRKRPAALMTSETIRLPAIHKEIQWRSEAL